MEEVGRGSENGLGKKGCRSKCVPGLVEQGDLNGKSAGGKGYERATKGEEKRGKMGKGGSTGLAPEKLPRRFLGGGAGSRRGVGKLGSTVPGKPVKKNEGKKNGRGGKSGV